MVADSLSGTLARGLHRSVVEPVEDPSAEYKSVLAHGNSRVANYEK